MARFIYGSEHWCVPIQQMNRNLLPVISELMGDYSNIKAQIDKRNVEISEMYNDYFTSIS